MADNPNQSPPSPDDENLIGPLQLMFSYPFMQLGWPSPARASDTELGLSSTMVAPYSVFKTELDSMRYLYNLGTMHCDPVKVEKDVGLFDPKPFYVQMRPVKWKDADWPVVNGVPHDQPDPMHPGGSLTWREGAFVRLGTSLRDNFDKFPFCGESLYARGPDDPLGPPVVRPQPVHIGREFNFGARTGFDTSKLTAWERAPYVKYTLASKARWPALSQFAQSLGARLDPDTGVISAPATPRGLMALANVRRTDDNGVSIVDNQNTSYGPVVGPDSGPNTMDGDLERLFWPVTPDMSCVTSWYVGFKGGQQATPTEYVFTMNGHVPREVWLSNVTWTGPLKVHFYVRRHKYDYIRTSASADATRPTYTARFGNPQEPFRWEFGDMPPNLSMEAAKDSLLRLFAERHNGPFYDFGTGLVEGENVIEIPALSTVPLFDPSGITVDRLVPETVGAASMSTPITSLTRFDGNDPSTMPAWPCWYGGYGFWIDWREAWCSIND